MKKIIPSIVFLLLAATAMGQSKQPAVDKPDASKKIDTVEASCGLCKFDMKANSCTLAVRINGKTYFVDGTDIDSHGDAHAKDGFCEAIRKAAVQGEVVDNRYKVTYFKLVN